MERLGRGGVMLADGAWGTLLHEMGLRPGECPELWNIERRDKVEEIAEKYVLAGAEIIGTNSFGASSVKLGMYGLDNMAEEINIEAARISREAAGTERFVFGSMGPTGKILMMGDISSEELFKSFVEQAKALQTGGADVLLIETMTALDEALLALNAAKENTLLPVAVCFTFDKTANNEYRTIMGVSPVEFCHKMVLAGADIVGTNCGNGMQGIIEICREIRNYNKEIPLMAQANAGMPEYRDGKSIFPEGPEEMASKIYALIETGVNIIGGCCGTGPAHIKLFAERISNFMQR